MDYEYEKKMIGLLIGYTRKKLNQQYGGTKFTQLGLINNFGKSYLENCTLCQSPCFKNKICSKNVLIEIEKGKAFKKDCYYVGLIENLGFKYQCDERIVRNILEIENNLLITLSTYELPKIIELNMKIDYELHIYNSVFYFYTLLQIYKSLVLLMLKNEKSYIVTDEILNLFFKYGNTNTKEIIAILIYNRDPDINKEVKNILNCKNKSHLFPYYLKFLRQNESYSLVHSAEELNKLLESNYNQLNEYTKYMLYDSLAFIYLNDHNTKKSYIYLKLCKKVIESSPNRFPDYFILQILNRLGLVNYLDKNYDSSIKYFLYLYKLDISKIYNNIILLFNMLESQNRINELQSLLTTNYYKLILLQEAKSIFRYYKLKYSKPLDRNLACELENLIVNNLILKSSIHNNIITHELKNLILITKNYKNHYLYIEKLEELKKQ